MNNSDRHQQENQDQKNNQAIDPECPPHRILAVKWSYRWDVFRRLQALGIKCQCSTNEPLLVDLHSPTTIVQIWSVLRQFNASRDDSLDWLDRCWQLKCDRQIYE